jgi:putative membrane protein insertion efficiency factor
MKTLLIGFVKLWRLLISPLYGDVCKFYPTCSAYGLESLQVHGAWHGSWLTIRRIVRCHPWSLGGYDPVPGTPAARAWEIEQRLEREAALADASSSGCMSDCSSHRFGDTCATTGDLVGDAEQPPHSVDETPGDAPTISDVHAHRDVDRLRIADGAVLHSAPGRF